MLKVGIDFDNTIISYDELFYEVAVSSKLANPSVRPFKNDIRAYVRSLDNGEIAWQKLQLEVYGRYIDKAPVSPMFEEFLDYCKDANVEVFVVSHKTQFAAQDDNREYDLIAHAKEWLLKNKIVSDAGPIKKENIFFEPTRSKKIGRIADIGCDIFIDDLYEVLQDDSFPVASAPWLFDPNKIFHEDAGLTRIISWQEAKVKLSHCLN